MKSKRKRNGLLRHYKIKLVLFIHEVPRASKYFFSYLEGRELNTKANVISVDRLGYGYSDDAQTSIEKQAESIYTIINTNKLGNVVLVSYLVCLLPQKLSINILK